MYRNLEAELRRKGIRRVDVAEVMKINIATVSDKLTKPDRLKLSEAFAIQRNFFPDLSIDYLFATEQKTA